ncbi:MAG: hypothetical protein PQJ50_11925 [Spirochaetales bacterium]|nr:hypothetical protein [Spirochaetales bacterium]
MIYYDLRKYSFIDRKYPSDENLKLLSEMHQIIEKEMKGLDAGLYRLNLDTALYYCTDKRKDSLFEVLMRTREKVNSGFQSRGIPSTLSIACAYGPGWSGWIELEKEKVFNLGGEVCSLFQKTLTAMENDKRLFDSVCFHHLAAGQTEKNLFSASLSVMGEEFYYV